MHVARSTKAEVCPVFKTVGETIAFRTFGDAMGRKGVVLDKVVLEADLDGSKPELEFFL